MSLGSRSTGQFPSGERASTLRASIGQANICPMCQQKAPFDDKESIVLVRKHAEQHGRAWAQCTLGQHYARGSGGCPLDPTQGYEWLLKAALNNDAIAMTDVAHCLCEGHGVQQDLQEAVAWGTRAAEAGVAMAQSNLGSMYYSGKGVNKDLRKAVQLWQQAADQGVAAAEVNPIPFPPGRSKTKTVP